jgi:hypothetical protein
MLTLSAYSDVTILLVNLLLQVCGILIILPLWKPSTPLWRYLFGTALVSWGFPLCQVELISVYLRSKELSMITRQRYSKMIAGKQGMFMGLLVAGGSAARLVAPLWSSFVFMEMGYTMVFSIVVAMLGMAMLVFLVSLIIIGTNLRRTISLTR